MPHAAQQPVKCAHGAAQARRHFLQREPFLVTQVQRLALVGGQFRDAVVQQSFALLEMVGAGLGLVSDGAQEVLGKIQPVAVLAFAEGEHLMERDLPRPRAEIRARLELREVPPHHDLCLLENVIRVLRMRHHRHHVRAERPLVAGEQEDEFFGAVGWVHGFVRSLYPWSPRNAILDELSAADPVSENKLSKTLRFGTYPVEQRMRPRTIIQFAIPLALTATLPADQGTDFFEKKIRPLLAERCLECHSPEKKVKGGLRLDTRAGWEKGGDTGPAIVPGEPDKSLLITAIRYTDPDLKMPEKRKLPDAEITLLEEWVKMGAPDPRTGGTVAKKQTGLSIEEGKKFWSYIAPKKVAPPVVKDEAWPRSDIDRFILAKAEAAGVKPAHDASHEVLARRVYLNLTGLPPTPEQIDAFVRSAKADPQSAREHLVDELLASKQFGERFGRLWLDVARFAESSGGGRTLLFKDAWHYRDYVIESINADVPFDRFIQAQIAGDILPTSSPEEKRRSLAATAFLALGPTNYEEQYKQQLRFDVVDEQLETIGRAFLGQTIGCARCHDHKFDPIPQRDYYALAGILASTRTLFNYTDNVARWIVTPLPVEGAIEEAIRAHEVKVAALEKEVASAKAELAKQSKGVAEETPKPGQAIAPADLPGIVLDDADAKLVGAWKQSKHVRSYIGAGYVTDDNTGKGEKTITFTPMLPKMGRYEVRLAYTHAAGRATNVRVTILHADGEDTVFVDETEAPPIDGRFVSLGKFRFEKDGAGYVLISNEDTKGFVTVDALQLLPEGEAAAPVANADKASPDRNEPTKDIKKLEAELKKLAKSGPARPRTMSVREDDEIADVQIRVRGIEKQRGETVPRGFLQVALRNAPVMPEKESGRRELAAWLTSPENPLTARVIVNRVWAWLFGSGIVRTVENFGTTGEKPSHPELLDHLALRFVEEGWSLKKLVREIVLTRTWQLGVNDGGRMTNDEKLARAAVKKDPQSAIRNPQPSDPENRLFAHANRRRLDAEQIRDTILAVSGELKLDYLGPNIAGAGDIDQHNFTAQNVEYGYVYADLRRSVYTPAFRNKRLELFEVFDFGDINSSISQRSTSTVAPQALFLLNHPFVVEQARAAAARTLELPDAARITAAFRRTLGRPPTDAERAKSARFLGSEPSLEKWAQLHQTLFACVDFRYID